MKKAVIIILMFMITVNLCACGGGTPHQKMTEPAVSAEPAPPATESVPTETAPPEPEETEAAVITPEDDELVRITDYVPTIFVDLKYATSDNFTGVVIYDFTEPYLRYGTVKKLAEAQDKLSEQDCSLKIWDAYRPTNAQFNLWEVCPDPAYVADPNTGFSNHSRGNTVDVTLVLSNGDKIEMPTGFDDFSMLADRDYSDVPDAARENVAILENAMSSCGFDCYFGEWWHYSDATSYPVVEN